MLIYNHKKEFIGITKAYLEMFDVKSFGELKEMANDFADFFTSAPGHIHNFVHVHWIDYILCDDSGVSPKIILNIKDMNYTANLDIKIIYLIDAPDEESYEINLSNIKSLSKDLEEEKVCVIEEHEKELDFNPVEINYDDDKIIHDLEIKLDIKAPIPVIIEDTYEEPTLKVKSNPIDNSMDYEAYTYNPSIASAELGLPEDLIEEFVEDFISQANHFKDDLYDAISTTDFTNIKSLSHKLKGVAANLRIENALELLTNINHSDSIADVKKDIDIFYKIVTILASANTKDDIVLSFKDDA